MEEMEELKKNLKKELRASSSISISTRMKSSAEQDELESDEQKMSRLVKDFLDKTKVMDKELPSFAPQTESLDEVQFRIRSEAKRLLWCRMQADLFNQEELTHLYAVLEKYSTPPPENEAHLDDDKYIIFKDYKKLREAEDPRFKNILTAKLFMRLITDDPFGRVPILSIFNYVMKKTWLKQTRIGLLHYDFAGKGYITEEGLDAYLRDLIPTLIQLNDMEANFEQFYLCTASRKFFFFLDPLRKSKIRIVDILSSGLIDDILDLREKEVRDTNWFSLGSTQKIYGHYLKLDVDHNGMLSKEEFADFSCGRYKLTTAFVDRLFSECVTYSGEMDYRTYVDFILAFENRREACALQYFFRILDTTQKGYLDAFDLNYFFKDIEQHYIEQQLPEPPKFADIKDEIFDMIKPEDPLKISLKDLIRCEMGETVVRILIDKYGLMDYDSRESPPPVQVQIEPRSSEV